MAEIVQLEHYLTPKFFAAAEAVGAVGISHNVELLHDVGAFVHAETGSGFPAPIENLDFAYFLAQGRLPRDWDTHYFQADDHFVYTPASQLAVPSPDRQVVTAGEIRARGRRVLEVPVKDMERPLVGPLVRALTTPPPEDARLTAGPGAWVEAVKSALTPRGAREGFTPTVKGSGRPDLEDEAIRRFPGALFLDRPSS